MEGPYTGRLDSYDTVQSGYMRLASPVGGCWGVGTRAAGVWTGPGGDVVLFLIKEL